MRGLAVSVALVLVSVSCGSSSDTEPAGPPPVSQLPAGPLEGSTEGGDADQTQPIPTTEAANVDDQSAPEGPQGAVTPTERPNVANVPTEPGSAQSVNLPPFVDGLAQITNFAHAGDNRLFVTLQTGEIMIVAEGAVRDRPFLDIADRTDRSASERGLFDVAFHPDYATNGFFFVNYTDRGGDTVVSRFEVSADADRADPASETVILRVDQPFRNHNGGHIEFGPDGYLYVAMGDGGSGGDPQGNGLDRATLLGSILRIDIDIVDVSTPYAIPPDNPFVGDENFRDEIWAYGVRNPWGFSFDAVNGDLYFADVGQDDFEEVDVAPAGVGGLNFGWNAFEGQACFTPDLCAGDAAVDHLPPVAVTHHDDGVCSITGGIVSRSPQQPELWGNYLFGDFCDGRIWAMVAQPDGSFDVRVVADESISTVAIGVDAAGNIYLADRLSDSLLIVTAAG